MKITLDTKALENLIGGDSDVEIELRNSIVQEFTKKYLKCIVNEDIVSKAESHLKKEIASNKAYIENTVKDFLIENFKSDGPYYNRTIIIDDEYKKKIRSNVSEAFQSLISTQIDEYKKTLQEDMGKKLEHYKSYYDKQIETKLADYINTQVNIKVQEKITAILTGVK